MGISSKYLTGFGAWLSITCLAVERCSSFVAHAHQLAILSACALAAIGVDQALPCPGCEPMSISISGEVEPKSEYHASIALCCTSAR